MRITLCALLLTACGASSSPLPLPDARIEGFSEIRHANRIEAAPVVFRGQLLEIVSARPSGSAHSAEIEIHTPQSTTTHDIGLMLIDSVADGDTLRIYGVPFSGADSVYETHSTDLQAWSTPKRVIHEPGTAFFNVSVTKSPAGWQMALETSQGSPFSMRWAASQAPTDDWVLSGRLTHADAYAACPCLRWVGGRYVLLWLRHNGERYFTVWASSTDLLHWTTERVLLYPDAHEGHGINRSDPAIADGWVYYATGDQETWGDVRRAPLPLFWP